MESQATQPDTALVHDGSSEDEHAENEQAHDDRGPVTQLAVRTRRFRSQHDVLLTMAVELKQLSQTVSTLEEAKQVRDHLNRLAGKLVVHLAKEDKSLYPQLLAASDKTVVALTKQYIDEMGDLAEVFNLFNRRWVTPRFIYKYQDKFEAEAAAIVEALATRIDKENNELYVLADALPAED